MWDSTKIFKNALLITAVTLIMLLCFQISGCTGIKINNLIQRLKSESPEIRQHAIEDLAEVGEPAVEPLIKLYDGTDERLIKGAKEALIKIGEPAIDDLLEAFKYEEGNVKTGKYQLKKAEEVRGLIRETLIGIGKAGLIKLHGALKDKDTIVRAEVASVLGEIKESDSVEPLIEALKDKETTVQINSMFALGKIGDKRAIESLQELEDNPDLQQWVFLALKNFNPPIAEFECVPDSISSIGNNTISLNASASTDSNGEIVSYFWDFGDGTTGTGKNVTHAYAYESRGFWPKLTVKDNDGLTGKEDAHIDVNLAVIKINITTSTWRGIEDLKYTPIVDIESTITPKLISENFGISSADNVYFDAILYIDLKEKKGDKYNVSYSFSELNPLSVPSYNTYEDYGTNIECNIKFIDRNRNQLFNKNVFASPSLTIRDETLYDSVLNSFSNKVYIKYLGKILASKCGVGDEVSVLISALDDDNGITRWSAVEALGEIGDKRAIEPLKKIAENQDDYVNTKAKEVLGKLQ